MTWLWILGGIFGYLTLGTVTIGVMNGTNAFDGASDKDGAQILSFFFWPIVLVGVILIVVFTAVYDATLWCVTPRKKKPEEPPASQPVSLPTPEDAKSFMKRKDGA